MPSKKRSQKKPGRKPAKPAVKKKTQAPPAAETDYLEDILQDLGIAADDWDLLIFGDGSGSNFDHACGWSAVTIQQDTLERRCWWGSMSQGTVNLAEMMAYIQPLSYFAAQEAKRRKGSGAAPRFMQVHIVTDSSYVKEVGQSGDTLPKKNGALWRAFSDFARHGFLLHWHWVQRDTVALNRFVDLLSREARLQIQRENLQELVETRGTVEIQQTVYDYNPSELQP
jgi:ribonuclease HI